MVALSIQQSSITSLLNQAEIRAANRCPIYNKNNAHWKRVDNLIEEQDKVLKKLLNFDQDMNMSKKINHHIVSDFVKMESPKKQACIGMSNGSNESDSNMVQGEDVTSKKSKSVSLP